MMFESRKWDEIEVGQSAELKRLCTADDFYVFAAASGNHNPVHLEAEDGDGDGQKEAYAPGMFVASLITAVLGNLLPGPGTLYRSQSLRFHDLAAAGQELCARVEVLEKLPGDLLRMKTEVRRVGDDALIVEGEAEVHAPQKHLKFDALEVPGLISQRHRHFEKLLEKAEPLPDLVTAVVCPEEPVSLDGALLAAEHHLIEPLLIGHPEKIMSVAKELGRDVTKFEILPAETARDAARMAVQLVNEGRAGAVMKGHLHTDALLKPMLDKATGLRIGKRFTHVFVMDVPGVVHPLIVTDAAINIAPDLETKVHIVQNAIDVAISIGIEVPKVGVLSAVETVTPAIPSSLDAALLSKMAERGQITGGEVDGPLAMDNAVDLAAARTKGIRSAVAGRAEVLVAPGIDSANMLAKQLAYISHAEGAGLMLGAKVPVILNSRSDSGMARLASAAVASIHYHRTCGDRA
ncbi:MULTISPECIES: bifunctional enoyl-CoA hydratase/phosphate acetyltransferase [Thioclava]|uniref:bifunctional enoyl-CoA hydratase/phosphate acetyltransferase n=1 Tax=Thioclava TaxID=285107 RepID=UPI000C4D95DA|nr:MULTISPECIES: bifunctional enoyl-CoA hydratase/phosphate acetyltransferase [Thioclava]MAQ38009.1 enoyl-CoA hydratase [Thioclava sp.]MPQ94861.1 bifunctional enoyl-CoA hydratase/phosphate acetyltransferase [Thioclava sp. JE_KL1]